MWETLGAGGGGGHRAENNGSGVLGVNVRIGSIHRCIDVSRYTPHGAVHDTQCQYRDRLRYTI